MGGLVLVNAPAVEPVSLAEAKAQARVENAADDNLIAGLITAARQWVEDYTRRALIAQDWDLWLDDWPCGARRAWWDGAREGVDVQAELARALVLPKAPLITVACVRVYDESDQAVVFASDGYVVDTARVPGRIVLRHGASWPVSTRAANGIQVSFTAGYGAAAGNVPEAVRTAIRQLVAHWVEHRGEASLGGDFKSMPMGVKALLDPYRVARVGA